MLVPFVLFLFRCAPGPAADEDDPVLILTDPAGVVGPSRQGAWALLPAVSVEGSRMRLGIRVDLAGEGELAVRSRSASTGFGDFLPMKVSFREGVLLNAFLDLPPGTTEAQVGFRGEGSITYAALEIFEAPKEPAEPDPFATTERGLVTDRFGVVSRAEWGARARSCARPHQPNRITVHHTFTPNGDSLSMPARVRQIQSYHIDVRGWCDIGYHFLVGQDGRIYQGRPESHVGAHAGDANRDNLGISFVGNFSDIPPSDPMLRSAGELIAQIAQEYAVPLDRQHLFGHREVGSTSTACPGDALFARLEELLDRAAGGQREGFYRDVPKNHWAWAAIETLRVRAVVAGCGRGTFCPDRAVTRAELAVLLARLHEDLFLLPFQPTFEDVPQDHWAYAGVLETAERGLMVGCGPRSFCPDDPVTRDLAATVLARLAGLGGAPPIEPTFADVPRGHWAFALIEDVAAAGLLVGCSEAPRAFCPGKALTRAETAVMLVRAFGL